MKSIRIKFLKSFDIDSPEMLAATDIFWYHYHPILWDLLARPLEDMESLTINHLKNNEAQTN